MPLRQDSFSRSAIHKLPRPIATGQWLTRLAKQGRKPPDKPPPTIDKPTIVVDNNPPKHERPTINFENVKLRSTDGAKAGKASKLAVTATFNAGTGSLEHHDGNFRDRST